MPYASYSSQRSIRPSMTTVIASTPGSLLNASTSAWREEKEGERRRKKGKGGERRGKEEERGGSKMRKEDGESELEASPHTSASDSRYIHPTHTYIHLHTTTRFFFVVAVFLLLTWRECVPDPNAGCARRAYVSGAGGGSGFAGGAGPAGDVHAVFGSVIGREIPLVGKLPDTEGQHSCSHVLFEENTT